MSELMEVDDEPLSLDPLDAAEAPLAAPPQVPPPPTPAPDPEPIPLDEPAGPIVAAPDRPDLGLAEPVADPAIPVDLPADDDPTAPPPAADPGGLMVLDRIDGVEAGLGRKLDALQAAFDREVRAEATREKVVDRLHAELQEYKQGLVFGILRPVFVELIQLHDDIGKMAAAPAPAPATASGAAPEAEPHPEVARILRQVGGYQQAIEDILERHGVDAYVHDGEAFDPRRQRALSTVPTADPARNKHVAARVRKGFQAGDKVIRPEIVTVYAHKPA